MRRRRNRLLWLVVAAAGCSGGEVAEDPPGIRWYYSYVYPHALSNDYENVGYEPQDELAVKEHLGELWGFDIYCRIDLAVNPFYKTEIDMITGKNVDGYQADLSQEFFAGVEGVFPPSGSSEFYNWDQVFRHRTPSERRQSAGWGFNVFYSREVYYLKDDVVHLQAAGVTLLRRNATVLEPVLYPFNHFDCYGCALSHEIGHQLGLDHQTAYDAPYLMHVSSSQQSHYMTGALGPNPVYEPAPSTECGLAREVGRVEHFFDP